MRFHSVVALPFLLALTNAIDISDDSTNVAATLRWGKDTLKGWWNENTDGRKPVTVLHGYDYVVVGSGPGGAPLAARLGLAGYKVLVLEAGADEAPTDWNMTVPYFNGKASEDPRIAWEFFVNHYPTIEQAARDPKYYYSLPNGTLYKGLDPPAGSTPRGTFYPRSATVGGCVAHNALIMLYPLDDDWDDIANMTGDRSWNSKNMRSYFKRMENCQYLAKGTPGHGFNGWLSTNRADESIFLSDSKVFYMLKAAASLTGQVIDSVTDLVTFLRRDINVKSPEYGTEHGIYNTPLNMDQYKRSSPRDFLVNTAAELSRTQERGSGKIDIRTNCLVTRVIFAPCTTRAIGVEFLDGQSLYRADPRSSTSNSSGSPGVAFASKEIILSGGAYNTPQLLKLSGIGATAELSQFQIPTVVDLPGVGRNLQDRYENSVIAETNETWTVFQGCTSGTNASDPCLVSWNTMQNNKTKYATNGRPVLLPMRSSVALNGNNDLIVTGRPGYFGGYFFGYSTISSKYPKAWTWPVLKAHTQNRGGTVTLLSSNPRDVPNITFNYFSSGTGNYTYDLSATVEGLQFARKILATYATLTNSPPLNELAPGPQYNTTEQLEQWVKDTSWGHHASCSCPIGADGDEMAVLDERFRVRGTQGLRVVDASVFPKIPGFYIQTSVYMVSEKAAVVIARDAERVGVWDATAVEAAAAMEGGRCRRK